MTYSREQRLCKCVKQPAPVSSNGSSPSPEQQLEEAERREELKKEMKKEIERDLSVPTVNVSATVRRYISAGDERTSSKALGLVMGVVCFVPLAGIVLVDLLALLHAASRRLWGLRDLHRRPVG